MNKRTKKLIFSISILMLLFVSYVFVAQSSKDSDSDKSSSDIEKQSYTKLGAFSDGSITAITFNDISLTLKDNKWLYADDSEYPVNNNAVNILADTLADLSYSDCIKKSEIKDLSVYGLESVSNNNASDNSTSDSDASLKAAVSDKLTLKVSFTADGAVHTYYIGSYNSITDGYYMTFDNDDYIYMVDAGITNAFNYETIYDLLVIDEIPEIDAAYMTGMAVVTPKTSYTFTPEIMSEKSTGNDVEANSETPSQDNTDTSSVVWYMETYDIASEITGERSAVDIEKFSTAVNNILTADSEKVIAYKPSDEELAAFGLSIPEYSVIITYLSDSNDTEEKSFTLSIGASDDNGNLYAVINNSKMIVTISDIDLENLLT